MAEAPNDVTANTADAVAFGLTQSLIAAYPELQKVWELFLAGNKTDAKLAYYQTAYYKQLSDIARARGSKKATQPGAYQAELNQYILSQKKRLIAKGIKLDDTVANTILQDAYDSGMTEDQVDLKALASFKGTFGGNILGSTQALKSYANSFGVGYTQNTIDSWSKDIFSGQIALEDIQAKIRTDAKSAFPAYSDQIDKGISMDAIASAYKSSMANILERDPDSITFEDPMLRKALQFTLDGKAAVKPLWQFEKELRSTSEWEYTNNARDTVDSLSLKVLRDWGLA